MLIGTALIITAVLKIIITVTGDPSTTDGFRLYTLQCLYSSFPTPLFKSNETMLDS